MAKFCTSCGAKNEDDSVFCEACGSNITAPRAPATLAAQPVAPGPPSNLATSATEPAAGGAASVAGKGAAIIGFVEGILRFLLNTGVYVFTYVALMLPTYALPYFGSNSAIVGGLSAAVGLGSFPTWWIHMMFLWGLLVIGWFRGRIIGKTWLWVLPFLAALFDMMPGINLIPLVPTGMHIAAIIVGARSAATSANASGVGGAALDVGTMRIVVALGGFALLLMGLLSSIATYDGRGRTHTAPHIARPLSPANNAPVATERREATSANPGIEPAASGAAPTTVARADPSSSGPHPNWHGTWQGTKPDSKMVITAAGVEIFDVHKRDGKTEKYRYMAPWGTKNPSGNGEESGYAKSSVSRAEILRAYEASVVQFRRDPSDFGISDPGLSRRFIGQIKPGNYRVVWADLGGDCGQRDMIVDDDLILSVSTCKYQHVIDLFTRVR